MTPLAPLVAGITRILIVDDHPLVRHGLSKLITAQPGLAICGEAASSQEALQLIRSLEPDLAIVDISLKGANGIELIKAVKAERPNQPILVASMHDESLYALRALRAGARGYLMKHEALDCVMEAIHKVLSGGIYVSNAMSEALIFKVVSGMDGRNGREGRNGGDGSILDHLTDRELEILQLVGEGHHSREIAEKLHLSIKTIESHRLNIKQKLDFKSSLDLVRFAMQWVGNQLADAV